MGDSGEKNFPESHKTSNLPFTNIYSFIGRIVATKCAEHSSHYFVSGSDSLDKDASSTTQLDKLRELEQLYAKRSEKSNKLKKEKQMGKQVELNTQIKKINDEIANIKGSL